jgi:hypothetical protein
MDDAGFKRLMEVAPRPRAFLPSLDALLRENAALKARAIAVARSRLTDPKPRG